MPESPRKPKKEGNRRQQGARGVFPHAGVRGRESSAREGRTHASGCEGEAGAEGTSLHVSGDGRNVSVRERHSHELVRTRGRPLGPEFVRMEVDQQKKEKAQLIVELKDVEVMRASTVAEYSGSHDFEMDRSRIAEEVRSKMMTIGIDLLKCDVAYSLGFIN
ncbi:hypothetical protein KSP39_PZI006764 [Platanthera zijinensis]|uniref:Uncharacterized protein n=1 Tax=Platanthera zijinensis TaxID=2320716 RepID=A0AAP0BS44_9ASPA